MTDPGPHDGDDLDLDIDLQLDLEPLGATPASAAASPPGSPAPGAEPRRETAVPELPALPELSPSGAGVVAEPLPQTARAPAATSDADELVGGQWVWQYGAPPPPPPFSAAFFSGQALAELYRFFACGLLVFIGCLLPWGKSVPWAVQHGESTLAYGAPPAGYEVPVGALSLVIAVWLMFIACYGIYTGRQKVLPVFLMLVPAGASWSRTLAAWNEIGALPQKLGARERLAQLFDVAGTGVLLTLIGSTIIVLLILVVIVKVFQKQPGESGAKTARPPRKPKDADRPAAALAAAPGGAPAPAPDAPAGEPTSGRKDRSAEAGEGKGDGGRRGRRR